MSVSACENFPDSYRKGSKMCSTVGKLRIPCKNLEKQILLQERKFSVKRHAYEQNVLHVFTCSPPSTSAWVDMYM